MANADWQSQLSVLEKNTYLDLFQKVDADNKGIVLQDEAMEFLKKSDIPQNILTQFWNATDNDKKGFLTDQEFCTILKLIACAQNGIMTTEPILATKAPLPEFNGPDSANNVNAPFQQTHAPPPQQSQLPAPQRQASVSNMDIVNPEDRLKYIGLFQSFGPVNNILSGERARAAFIRSNLPPEILQTIWTLADTRKSGTLNQTEFIIAMHYIENAMKGMTNMPSSLPANVYASATGRPVPAGSPLVRNNTLQVHSPPPVPMRSPVFKGVTIAKVDISPDEYAKYKTFFRQLDTDNSGYVSGADAVVFFRHSKLPELDLAHIWDLADTNSSGHLSEQEFAIAMHMINRRVAGGEIPESLPAFNSIPDYNPPLHQQQQQQQPQQQQPQQQNIDLLGLSSDFNGNHVPPTPQQQQPQYNNNNNNNNNADLTRTQSTLLSDMTTERLRSQTAQSQLHVESQAVQELQRQIEQQKEELAKLKKQADDTEKELEAEKKRKEELTKELQMYKQEAKHFNTRIENADEETAKLQKENAELEKEKQAKSVVQSPSQPAPTAAHDFFSLSSALPANSPGGLFAKVQEPSSSSFSPVTYNHTGSTVNSQQPKFDPFAGFKATQPKHSTPVSPTVSMNKLKQETEQKRSFTPSSNVEISDIESKFPDLNTMEQNFETPSSPVPPNASSPAVAAMGSPSLTASATSPKPDNSHLYNNVFSKPAASPSISKSTPAKKDANSKYGFDLSAFESPSLATASPFETKTSMKDELSSLFGSPSINNAQLPSTTTSQNTGFDDIFGASSSNNNNNTSTTNSFENVFFQK